MLALLLALIAQPALAAAPAVPPVQKTVCYEQVLKILQTDYNDFKVVDGQKIGAEFVSFTNVTRLPVMEYSGMNSEYHFGLVGYAMITYHGDATTHTYLYTVSAHCSYDEATKAYALDNSIDREPTKDDISLQSMDFERR